MVLIDCIVEAIDHLGEDSDLTVRILRLIDCTADAEQLATVLEGSDIASLSIDTSAPIGFAGNKVHSYEGWNFDKNNHSPSVRVKGPAELG